MCVFFIYIYNYFSFSPTHTSGGKKRKGLMVASLVVLFSRNHHGNRAAGKKVTAPIWQKSGIQMAHFKRDATSHAYTTASHKQCWRSSNGTRVDISTRPIRHWHPPIPYSLSPGTLHSLSSPQEERPAGAADLKAGPSPLQTPPTAGERE